MFNKYLSSFLLIVLMFVVFNGYSQKNSIYGIITDADNGEQIAGCNIFLIDKTKGVTTNAYGYYSLELVEAEQAVVFSCIGYQTDTFSFNLTNDSLFNHSLIKSNTQLTQVEIKAEQQTKAKIGQIAIKTADIKAIPAVMGEPDVIKSLQLLPGVQTTNEGTTNLSIRGGTHDQNLILFDEAPVYNPSHALSLVSAFNIDVLKEATLYKGYFPANYGGRLSSVIAMRMKEGNNKKLAITGGIGIIASRISLEIPIIKNRTSLIVSNRFGYPGTTLNGIRQINNIPNINIPQLNNIPKDNVVWFYDLNFKINHKIDLKNKVYISAYTSKDEFELKPLDARSNTKWGNTTITGRWNHIKNSKVFVNHTIFYSNYNYSLDRINDANNYIWKAGLKESDYKLDIDNYYSPNHKLKYGLKIGYHKFKPGEIIKSETESNYKKYTLHNQQAVSTDLYISDKYTINKKIEVTIGVRYSSMTNLGPGTDFQYDNLNQVIDTIEYSSGEIIKYHWGLEPRLNAKYSFNSTSAVQLSYGRTRQYVHLLSNSSVGMPTDVWVPSNNHIKPSYSNQYSIGYYLNYPKVGVDFSLEVYYRNINNIIDFIDNANLFLNDQIETQILSGKRKSFGMELMAKKEIGKLKGWISYTLSKTNQKIKGVNMNKWYPAYFDKRHNMAVFITYALTKQLELGTVFKFSNGGNITVPKEIFVFGNQPYISYSERNAYKLPNYHRLDISLKYKSKKNDTRKWKSEWALGIMNVYNRKNIFTIDIRYKYTGELAVSKIYLYGILPYVSYSFKI